MTSKADKHEQAPDLLLITARALREHLHSVGKGKACDELDAALKSHEDKEDKKAR